MALINKLIPTERKAFSPASDINWTRIETLVHGPGAGTKTNEGGDFNSAVFACLMAIALAYTEPPAMVYQRDRDGLETNMENSPLQRLLDMPTPNGEISKSELWFWTAWALHTDGNAYWLKVRSGNAEIGNVVQLWPVSPLLMWPVTEKDADGRPKEWISYYKMRVSQKETIEVPVTNVVHFRLGLDDRDMRSGLSPLKRLLRHIASDDEATKFIGALLRNYAVPGLVIIPEDDTMLDEDDAARIEAKFAQKFTNDSRGSLAVLSRKAHMERFGFSPKELEIGTAHFISEERIAAVMGVPAILAGLGAGLARGTFNNARELREWFTESKLVPLWRHDADKLNASLKPDFTADRNIYIGFDLSQVRALQEDETALYRRLDIAIQGMRPWVTVNEGRSQIGLDPVDGGDELIARGNPIDVANLDSGGNAANENGEGEKRLPFGNGHTPTTERKITLRQLIDRRLMVRQRVARRAETAIDAWFKRLASLVTADAFNKAYAGHETKQLTEAEVLRTFEQLFRQESSELEAILRTHTLLVIRDSWDWLNIELNETIQFRDNDPLVVQILRQAGDKITNIRRTTLDALRDALPGLYEEGAPIDEVADVVRGLVEETYSNRGRAIARTEIGTAQQQAASARYRQAGVNHVRVFDNGFDNSHEFCRYINGRVVTIEWAERNPLQHPNCLLPGSQVVAPNREAGFARWFEGEAVTISTSQNDNLSCTPNHPILTTRGWVAAGELHEGDYVIRSLDSQGIAELLLDPDCHQMPTSIEDVLCTPVVPGCVSTCVVPTSPEDFHGDGVGSKIHVETAYGFLGYGFDSPLDKQIVKSFLETAVCAVSRLSSFGDLSSVDFGLLFPPNSVVGGGSDLASEFRGGGFVKQLERLGLSTAVDAVTGPDPLTHGRRGDAVSGSNFSSSFSLLDVELLQDFIRRPFFDFTRFPAGEPGFFESTQNGRLTDADGITNFLGRLARLVQPVKVVDVKRFDYAGHVYNLQTLQGWYVADSIITHNCVRAFGAVFDYIGPVETAEPGWG